MAAAMITAWAMTSQRASPRLWLLKMKQRSAAAATSRWWAGSAAARKNEKRWMN